MKRLVLFQVALAMVCALVLGHLGEQLVQTQANMQRSAQ